MAAKRWWWSWLGARALKGRLTVACAGPPRGRWSPLMLLTRAIPPDPAGGCIDARGVAMFRVPAGLRRRASGRPPVPSLSKTSSSWGCPVERRSARSQGSNGGLSHIQQHQVDAPRCSVRSLPSRAIVPAHLTPVGVELQARRAAQLANATAAPGATSHLLRVPGECQSAAQLEQQQTAGGGDRRQQHPLPATRGSGRAGTRFVRCAHRFGQKLVSWSALWQRPKLAAGQTERIARGHFPVSTVSPLHFPSEAEHKPDHLIGWRSITTSPPRSCGPDRTNRSGNDGC